MTELNALMPTLTLDEIEAAFQREREVGAGQAVSQAQRVKDAKSVLHLLRYLKECVNDDLSQLQAKGEPMEMARGARATITALAGRFTDALREAGVEVEEA